MTSKGLGEMVEGDSVDMFAGKFPLVWMESRAEGLACAGPPSALAEFQYATHIILILVV